MKRYRGLHAQVIVPEGEKHMPRKGDYMSDPEEARRLSLMQQLQQRAGRYHHSLASSPIICFVIAAMCLFFGVCATLIDIRTTENLALGIPGSAVGVAWQVILQPYQLLTGDIPSSYQLAYLYAWGVELIQLIFALALVIAVNKLSTVNTTIGKWFMVCGTLLILLNAYANFQSAPTSNPLIQVLMAVCIGGLAVVGLPLAIGFAEHGFSEL